MPLQHHDRLSFSHSSPSYCHRVCYRLLATHPVHDMSAPPEPPADSTNLQYGARAPPLHPPVTHRVTPTATPYHLAGKVVPGFQRGSKQLGFPTANLDPAAFTTTLSALPRGVYCGFVQVDRSTVHATVLSLGTNPTFGTKEETLEAYVMGWEGGDFYGAEMRLVVCGYVRPQYTMGGLEELIAWIKADVAVTEQTLQQPPYTQYRRDTWFDSTQQKQPSAGVQHVSEEKPTGSASSSALVEQVKTSGTERLRSNV